MKYQVGHGYTSCVSQPYVMEYNLPASAAKQALLARAAGHDIAGMSDEAAAELAARTVDDFILGLGMPHRMRELEIPEEDLPEIAELVLEDGGCRNNAIQITEKSQVTGGASDRALLGVIPGPLRVCNITPRTMMPKNPESQPIHLRISEERPDPGPSPRKRKPAELRQIRRPD